MHKITALTILIAFTLSCQQKSPPIDSEKNELTKTCDSIMSLFRELKTTEALNLLKLNSAISKSTIETLDSTIKEQVKSYFPAYGKITSAEFITERNIKTFLSQRLYILRFDNYYLKFDFTLYKATQGWTITNFKYNEDLIDVFY